jgi:hypothetical protein
LYTIFTKCSVGIGRGNEDDKRAVMKYVCISSNRKSMDQRFCVGI